MSPPTVELDFFPLNNNSSSNSRLISRQRSFRDIQSAISKINPDVLRSVIASGSANQEKGNEYDKCLAMPVIPKEDKTNLTALPLYPLNPLLQNPVPRSTAPLTIFYNGTVAVFDVPRDKAEAILKIAEKGTSRAFDSFELKEQRQQLIETLEGDLPIARRKSLERFLEKRKERLTSTSPYYCVPESRA